MRRQLIDIGEVVVNNAFGAEPELDGVKQVEAAEQALFNLAAKGGTDRGFVTFKDALIEAIHTAERAFHRSGGVSGLSTGLRDLDRVRRGEDAEDRGIAVTR
jgi:replicative DNA helicase